MKRFEFIPISVFYYSRNSFMTFYTQITKSLKLKEEVKPGKIAFYSQSICDCTINRVEDATKLRQIFPLPRPCPFTNITLIYQFHIPYPNVHFSCSTPLYRFHNYLQIPYSFTNSTKIYKFHIHLPIPQKFTNSLFIYWIHIHLPIYLPT